MYTYTFRRCITINIYTQVCGIIIPVIILMMIILNKRRLFLRTEIYFLAILISALLVNVTDIVSQYILLHHDDFSVEIQRMSSKIYALMVTVVVTATMGYINADIFYDKKEYYRKNGVFMVVALIAAFAIAILPIEVYTTPGHLYGYGASTMVAYAYAFSYAIFIIFRVSYFRNRVNSERRKAVIIWMVYWIASGIVEFVSPNILVVSFACSVGVMILYARLENSSISEDRESGLCSSNSYIEYANQLYGENKSFSLITIIPRNVRGVKGFNWSKVKGVLNAGRALAFRKSEEKIVLIFKTPDDMEQWVKKFDELSGNVESVEYECISNGLWVIVRDSSLFNNSEDLSYCVKHITTVKAVADKRTRYNLNQEMVDEIHIVQRRTKTLEYAIANGKVEVFYQPIYSTAAQSFTSAEALVRIRDKEDKLIFPGDFIDIAERTGLIIELGKEVFRQVCEFISEHNLEEMGLHYIEINLSTVQCSEANLADEFIGVMEEYGINPKSVNLEITETSVLENKTILLDNMEKLISYGVTFSLDDFGTGQSNLNYIVDMPVEIVKFDREMVSSYFDNMKAKYVMDAAMHMIHGMGLKIVSEGIETVEQFAHMRELGISYIQGYYFSKPISRQDFVEFINIHNKEKEH